MAEILGVSWGTVAEKVAPACAGPAELKAGDAQSASSGVASNNRFPAFPIGPASAAPWE
jgi:hypothetical protein